MKARLAAVFLLAGLVAVGIFAYKNLEQSIYESQNPNAWRTVPVPSNIAAASAPAQPSTSIPIPPAPGLTPEQKENRENLKGVLYSKEPYFAIFNYDASRLSFFDISTGTLFCRGDGESPPVCPPAKPNWQGKVIALCASTDVGPAGECSKPVYPDPKRVVQSDVLQVITQRGATPDVGMFLVSSERYRAARNTALNSVSNPFYAVYEISGKELFRLPRIELSSGTYLFAMGINPTEPAALFGVGGLIDVCNAEEDYDMPANVTEVLIWTPPANLKKVRTDVRTPAIDEFRSRFGVDDHWFKFFNWPADRHGC